MAAVSAPERTLIAGLGEDAGDLRSGCGLGEVVEAGGDLVMAGVEAEDAESLLQVEHLLLRCFDLAASGRRGCLERNSETRSVASKRAFERVLDVTVDERC